jgi:hypothetical protein
MHLVRCSFPQGAYSTPGSPALTRRATGARLSAAAPARDALRVEATRGFERRGGVLSCGVKAAPEADIGMSSRTPDRQWGHRARIAEGAAGAQVAGGERVVYAENVDMKPLPFPFTHHLPSPHLR